MIDKFKAGDFTSGKMAAIFKACFFRDVAHISHKQFGNAYLVPEDIVRVAALCNWLKMPGVLDYIENFLSMSAEDFSKQDIDYQKHSIEDFYQEEFNDWLDILYQSPRLTMLAKVG